MSDGDDRGQSSAKSSHDTPPIQEIEDLENEVLFLRKQIGKRNVDNSIRFDKIDADIKEIRDLQTNTFEKIGILSSKVSDAIDRFDSDKLDDKITSVLRREVISRLEAYSEERQNMNKEFKLLAKRMEQFEKYKKSHKFWSIIKFITFLVTAGSAVIIALFKK